MRRQRVMVVAGEESGDQHAARLIRDLRKVWPDVDLFGIGGTAMRREGVRILVDAREMAVVGFWEVLTRIGFFLRVFRHMKEQLRQQRPDALLLVDYPGFNLRLARVAKQCHVPVLYYISPQVWAWNRRRIPRMAKLIDLLMVIFPFEISVFQGTGLPVVFVGHPLVESVRRTLARTPERLPWPPGAHPVALLPGSRRMEIQRILPVMLQTALELRRRDPETSFAIAAASEEAARQIAPILETLSETERAAFCVVTGNMREICRHARAAMVCSGTATVETALLKCPMIVVYRAAGLTYWMGRMLIRVKWLGMVNLIADRTLCPEFIQQDAAPVAMADALQPLLEDGPARQTQLDGLNEVAAALEGDADTPTAGQTVAGHLRDLAGKDKD